MKKIFLLTLLMLCIFIQMQSQTVGGYTFSVDNTTAYSVVTGGTVVFGCPSFSSGDESAVVTLPKSFTYEGIGYTNIRVGYGGWISFGSNDPLATDAAFARDVFTKMANVPGAIAVCSKSDYGPNNIGGNCITEVATSSTTDEFVVQWKNIDDPEYSTYGLSGINFQLKLEFSTGVIKLCYGGFTGGLGYGQTVIVGLRGNGLDFNKNINNRLTDFTSNGWINSTRGNDAGATCDLSSLPSNLSYIYTPSSCLAPASMSAFNATGNSIKLIWNNTGSDGYEYAINTGIYAAAPSSGTLVTDTFATVSGLASTTIYSAWVRGKCGTSYTAWIQALFRTVCGPVTTLPYTETYPASSSIFLSGAHTYFPCIAVQNDNLSLDYYNLQWQLDSNGDGIALDNETSSTVVSSWYFTKRVQLTAGTTYKIHFQYQRTGFNINQNNVLKLQMATYPDTTSLVGSPLLNIPISAIAYDNTTFWDQSVLFTPSISGFYCAGFYTTSSTGLGEMKVLEVDILNNSILPLTLLSFNAQLQNKNVLLQWQTTNEINTNQFIIERSNNSRGFTVAGTVYAATNNSGQNNYSFNDDISNVSESNPILYYRLKMMDKDGKFTYSKIVSINIKNTAAILKIFPNPAESVLNIQLPSNTILNSTLKIADEYGRIVLQKTLIANAATTSFNIAKLSAGIYYVTLEQNGQIQKIAFVKQ